MRFEDYFLGMQNIYQKDRCPSACPFKALHDVPIVGIPTPQWPHRLAGVLVSRDPAVAFIAPYLAARRGLINEWRSALMLADAPPQWLVRQIAAFDRRHMAGAHGHEIEKLCDLMADNVYWTHLHKCCTDKTGKAAGPFKYENAALCSDYWLKREIAEAIAQGAKFVLCLGSDVERFFTNWESPEKERIKFLFLPYPAAAVSGAWNPKNPLKKKRIADTIDGLFNVINTS